MVGAVRRLRLVGIAEGISFLVLLLIAMPLKYFFEFPLAVKFVGWAHGVLFILYIIAVLLAIKAMRWNWFNVLIALAASLAPAGTLLLDRAWKKRLNELNIQFAQGCLRPTRNQVDFSLHGYQRFQYFYPLT